MTKGELATVALAISLVPVWRSGGRTKLNFWEFILNHTIWGPPIEYVPEEKYTEELKGIKLCAEIDEEVVKLFHRLPGRNYGK